MRRMLRILVAIAAGFVVAFVVGRFCVLPLMRILLPSGLHAGGDFNWRSFWTRFAPLHVAHAVVVGVVIGRVSGIDRRIAVPGFVAIGLPMALPSVIRLGIARDADFVPVLAQTFLPLVGILVGGLGIAAAGGRR